MTPIDLVMICVTAFAAVFLLLTLVALLMRVINLLFPARRSAEADTAAVAAVATVFAALYPGARITKIEEQK